MVSPSLPSPFWPSSPSHPFPPSLNYPLPHPLPPFFPPSRKEGRQPIDKRQEKDGGMGGVGGWGKGTGRRKGKADPFPAVYTSTPPPFPPNPLTNWRDCTTKSNPPPLPLDPFLSPDYCSFSCEPHDIRYPSNLLRPLPLSLPAPQQC